ncbi:hypothetical protein FGG08_002729 [Glutinoglossum americanum]|uniref:Uncharacterized protein n=1 Tax=Glutinoglossum americanum TaxID=1670608 RepID=A0A9P8ICA7_9PEZI|nr:hypothetical protein FGG08_002729 [Glutinoglossum americanum]
MAQLLSFESPSVRFNNHLVPSPLNAQPPVFQHGTCADILEAYSQAASLFHAYEYHQAIKAYKRLLRQKQSLVNEALLWFNIGILRDHLGEHALASEAYEKAVKLDGSFSLGWFCLGNSLSLISNFRRALRVFKICEKTLRGDSIDYHHYGLPWKLEKTRVTFNIRQTELRKLHKQHKAPLDHTWSLNRLPAGNIFEPGTGILGNGRNTKTPADLANPDALEPPELQARAGVGSLLTKHNQLRRHATTGAGLSSIKNDQLGRRATDRASSRQKPLPLTPDEFPRQAAPSGGFNQDRTLFTSCATGRTASGDGQSVGPVYQTNSRLIQTSSIPAMAPQLASSAADMPTQFGSLPSLQDWERKSFKNRYHPASPLNHPVNPPDHFVRPSDHPVRLFDSQERANVQPSTRDPGQGNLRPPRRARSERLDSFSIFALGEPQLRELQAAANEASANPAKALGRNRSLKSGRFNERGIKSEAQPPAS